MSRQMNVTSLYGSYFCAWCKGSRSAVRSTRYSWKPVFISIMLQTCTNLMSPWSCNTLNPRPWNCHGLGFLTLKTSMWISSELFTRATRAKKTSAHSKLQRETPKPEQWSTISNLARGMKILEDDVWFGYACILIFSLRGCVQYTVLEIWFFWGVTLSSLVYSSRRFERSSAFVLRVKQSKSARSEYKVFVMKE